MWSWISGLFKRDGWFADALAEMSEGWIMGAFFASELVRIARSQLGNGESGGNNRGPYIAKLGGKQGQSWCARFVGWCIINAAIALGMLAPIKPTGGARRLFRRCCKAGRKLGAGELPQPGDIVAWRRGKLAWQGHIGIVSRVEGERWWYIAGNEGRFPAVVEEHRGHGRRLIGFARLG